MSAAVVMIGALRVNIRPVIIQGVLGEGGDRNYELCVS